MYYTAFKVMSHQQNDYIYILAKVPALSCRSPPPSLSMFYPIATLLCPYSRFLSFTLPSTLKMAVNVVLRNRANHGTYELPIKTNGFFIECWLFWAIVWHNRWSSREATGLSKFMRVKMKSLIACVASREPLEIYKNKLARARDHSNHLAKFG